MLWLMSYIIQKDIAIPKWMVWSPIPRRGLSAHLISSGRRVRNMTPRLDVLQSLDPDVVQRRRDSQARVPRAGTTLRAGVAAGQGTARRWRRNSRESMFLQASPQVRAPARQVRDVGPAHQASPQEHRCDLELAGLVLDGLGARCAERPSLTALSRVLGDDASAAPASSSTARGALEHLAYEALREFGNRPLRATGPPG